MLIPFNQEMYKVYENKKKDIDIDLDNLYDERSE